MKKLIFIVGILYLLILLTGCSKSKDNNVNEITNNPTPTVTISENNVITPTVTPTITPTAAVTLPPVQTTEPAFTIADYYPFKENTKYEYQGQGNEYASYTVFTDYKAVNRIQYRINNGGSEVIEVLEYKDGALTKTFSRAETYYRENFLNEKEGKKEILLMEPLVKGTEWTLPDNKKRYISNIDVSIETPAGTYNAIEVTTEGSNSSEKTIDYYAKEVGLVKSVYITGSNDEITSTLSEILDNTPYKQTVIIYYPNIDTGKIYAIEKQLSFKTNDITRKKIEEAAKEIVKSKYKPLLTANTKINSLYLNKDNVVYVDFTKELVSEMNAGSEYESMVLQCITNTLGNYYNADKVYITLAGKLYESGHITMKKGEYFKVNYDNVIK